MDILEWTFLDFCYRNKHVVHVYVHTNTHIHLFIDLPNVLLYILWNLTIEKLRVSNGTNDTGKNVTNKQTTKQSRERNVLDRGMKSLIINSWKGRHQTFLILLSQDFKGCHQLTQTHTHTHLLTSVQDWWRFISGFSRNVRESLW